MHLHSIRSSCGFHTLLEIVSIINKRGLSGFALTDHSPSLGTPKSHFGVLLRRMPSVIDGLRLIKGIEASVMNVDGDLDLPVFKNLEYEIVLAGLHPHDTFAVNRGREANTRALINTMRRYPQINIITHPMSDPYEVDIDALTDVALETGTALEINNSRFSFGRERYDALAAMVELAGEKGTMLAVNSDGHVFSEMGNFKNAISFLRQFDTDRLNIVNRSLESTYEFLNLDIPEEAFTGLAIL
ncbi:hypothetical protein ACFL47_00410 [Candidatus Latescibacterota bacterium]